MEFDRDKFRELVVYVSERLAEDPSFGDTKLNKVLYFVDFLGYSHLGHAVTGARYQKERHGPLARPLLPVRQELEQEGAVHVEMRPAGTRTRRVTTPLRGADMSHFSMEEVELIDSIIDQLRGHSAVAVSRISHQNSPGWQLAEIGEDIPYATALIARDPAPPEIRRRGQELAERFGW
jgi:hypothetical protein